MSVYAIGVAGFRLTRQSAAGSVSIAVGFPWFLSLARPPRRSRAEAGSLPAAPHFPSSCRVTLTPVAIHRRRCHAIRDTTISLCGGLEEA